MTYQEHVSSFIRSSFPSVWSLELVLLLKRDPRRWPREEIVAALRASELVVEQSLASLTVSGLVSVDAEGGAVYSPASPDLAELVEKSAAFYQRSPDAVRRLIVVGRAHGSIAAFADAFRFRKD